MFLQECHKFWGAEICKNVFVPNKGGGLGLSGQLNHAFEGRAIGEHVDLVVRVAVRIEVFPRGNAPRAPKFDVKVHRRDQPGIFSVDEPPANAFRRFK